MSSLVTLLICSLYNLLVFAVLFFAVPCSAVSCSAVSCSVVQCSAVQCNVMLCPASCPGARFNREIQPTLSLKLNLELTYSEMGNSEFSVTEQLKLVSLLNSN